MPAVAVLICVVFAAAALPARSDDVPAIPAKTPLPPARTLFDTASGSDLLRGNGSGFGYVLRHGAVLPETVQVRLDGSALSASAFSVDAATGNITLRQAAPAGATIEVRYKYRRDGLVPTTADPARALAALPSFVMLQQEMGSFGELGIALGFQRSDSNSGATPLLGLRTQANAGGQGLSGLLFLTPGSGSLGQVAQSLAEDTGGSSATAVRRGHLIDQKLAIGGGTGGSGGGAHRSQVTFSYQDVAQTFDSFDALRLSGAASADDLARLKKERGLKRLGIGGDLLLGGSSLLKFSHSDLSGGNGGILRQSALLSTGGFSVTANLLRVDETFNRFGDLAAENPQERDMLAKFAGGKRFDVNGKWNVSPALSFEGSLLDQNYKGAQQKNSRFALSLLPAAGFQLNARQETTDSVQDDRRTGTLLRAYDLSLAPPRSLSVLALSSVEKTTTNPGGDKIVDQTRTFDLQSKKLGPLNLHLNGVENRISPDSADARVSRSLLTEAALALSKTSRISAALQTALTTQGDVYRSQNQKQSLDFTFGRGYRFVTQLDQTLTRAGDQHSEKRLSFFQMATDTAAPIYLSGERRMALGEKAPDRAEMFEKWDGGLKIGSLSLTSNGFTSSDDNLSDESAATVEKNHDLQGTWKLTGGWAAALHRFDRHFTDPKSKQLLDEAGHDFQVAGAVGGVKVSLRDASYDNRTDDASAHTTQEVALTPLQNTNLGPLKNSALTVAVGTDKVRVRVDGGASAEQATGPNTLEPRVAQTRGGERQKLALSGSLGSSQVGLEYGDGVGLTGESVTTKGIRIQTNPKAPLQISALYKERPRTAGPSTTVTSGVDIKMQMSGSTELKYSVQQNPERPDGMVEARRAESLSLTSGRDGDAKLTADWRREEDKIKRLKSETTAVALVGPSTPQSAYELGYEKQAIRAADQSASRTTYTAAYQYQPDSGALNMELAVRWVDQSGELQLLRTAAADAQAHLELRFLW